MSYKRVIPRDLFNESKLLKCLGKLATAIHDGVKWPNLRLNHDTDTSPGFLVEQDPDTGDLYCSNLTLRMGEKEIIVCSIYNSRQPYPLMFMTEDFCLGDVFKDDGSFSQEFTNLLDNLEDWQESQE